MDKNIENFHKSRIMFALINNKLEVSTNDARGHIDWLMEDFNISTEDFKDIPRGYIKDYKIQLYKGLAFGKILDKQVLDELIEKLAQYVTDKCDSGIYEVYNGVEVGKPGDVWKPLETCATIYANV